MPPKNTVQQDPLEYQAYLAQKDLEEILVCLAQQEELLEVPKEWVEVLDWV